MALFSVRCPTCSASLAVRRQSAIGQIHECPRCRNMVQVTPPPGWSPPSEESAKPAGERPAKGDDSTEFTTQEPSRGWFRGKTAPQPETRPLETMAEAGVDLEDPAASYESTVIEPLFGDEEGQETEATAGKGAAAGFAASPDEAPSTPGVAPAELLASRWALFGGSAAATAVLAVAAFYFTRGEAPPKPPAPAEVPAPALRVESEPASQPPAEPVGEPAPLDARWLPSQTRGILSVALAEWAASNEAPLLQARLGPLLLEAAGETLESFRLSPEDVGRATWACVDLPNARRSVLAVECSPSPEAVADWKDAAEKLDWRLAGAEVFRFRRGAWTQPFALVDGRTLVTGPSDLLEELAVHESTARESTDLASHALATLLQRVGAGRNVTLMLDLDAVRAANWNLPRPWLEGWTSGREDYNALYLGAEGVSLGLGFLERDGGEAAHAQLHLICPGDSAAEHLRAALENLRESSQAAVAAELESLGDRLRSAQVNAQTASQMKLLLTFGAEALGSSEIGAEGPLVWARTHARGDVAQLAVAAVASVPAWEAGRLQAARRRDEANHRQVTGALASHDEAEGHLPAAAAGSPLLPGERRLSWIATLLPYLDRLDWHEQLSSGRSWNDPVNEPVTRRPLPPAINPALGEERTPSGFPVTHYVGVAGVGADARELPDDHPRAGLFGDRRQMSLESLGDGASQTIAILGVTAKTGPWASGGGASVRALTARPYFNGPDGFGSGQPDGMLAGMADGSVRFFSADTDPALLERLASKNVRGPAPEVASVPAPQAPADLPEPAPETEDRPPERPPLPRVAVEEKLATPIPAIDFRDVPLSDFVQFLSQLSGVRVALDVAALDELGLTPQTRVSVKLENATLAEILRAALEEHGLAVVADENVALVTNPRGNRGQLEERVHRTADLCRSDEEARWLAGAIVDLVEPETWSLRGGPGRIEVGDGQLDVSQTPPVQRQVSRLLDDLRAARLRATADPKSLATRRQRSTVLAKEITANFSQPARLNRIVAYLEEASGATILFDGLALRAEGVDGQSKATLTLADGTLEGALDALCAGLRITWRIVDERTVQLTGAQAAAARLEVEIYPLAPRIDDSEGAAALIAALRREVAANSWREAGGRGALHYDNAANLLLVAQPQSIQFQVEEFLSSYAAEERRR